MTSSPPTTGPRAGANVVGTVRIAAALTRSPGGKARYSIAIPTGASMPPPAPWRIRNATSSPRLDAIPHNADAAVNTAMAVSMTRLPPKRSPSQPEAGMKTARLTRKAIETLSTAVALTPKSRPIVGRATLTIVTSMMLMNIAATKTVPTATFWLMRAATVSSLRDPVSAAAQASGSSRLATRSSGRRKFRLRPTGRPVQRLARRRIAAAAVLAAPDRGLGESVALDNSPSAQCAGWPGLARTPAGQTNADAGVTAASARRRRSAVLASKDMGIALETARTLGSPCRLPVRADAGLAASPAADIAAEVISLTGWTAS